MSVNKSKKHHNADCLTQLKCALNLHLICIKQSAYALVLINSSQLAPLEVAVSEYFFLNLMQN